MTTLCYKDSSNHICMKEQTAYSSNQPPSHAKIDAVNTIGTRINYLSFIVPFEEYI